MIVSDIFEMDPESLLGAKMELQNRVFIFEVPIIIPSNNVLLKMHWAQRRRFAEQCKHDVWFAYRGAGYKRPKSPPVRAKVRIISLRKKLLDKDNLYGGTKYLIDALVSHRFIYDDDPAHIRLTVEQQKSKNPRTVIAIMALNGSIGGKVECDAD